VWRTLTYLSHAMRLFFSVANNFQHHSQASLQLQATAVSKLCQNGGTFHGSAIVQSQTFKEVETHSI